MARALSQTPLFQVMFPLQDAAAAAAGARVDRCARAGPRGGREVRPHPHPRGGGGRSPGGVVRVRRRPVLTSPPSSGWPRTREADARLIADPSAAVSRLSSVADGSRGLRALGIRPSRPRSCSARTGRQAGAQTPCAAGPGMRRSRRSPTASSSGGPPAGPPPARARRRTGPAVGLCLERRASWSSPRSRCSRPAARTCRSTRTTRASAGLDARRRGARCSSPTSGSSRPAGRRLAVCAWRRMAHASRRILRRSEPLAAATPGLRALHLRLDRAAQGRRRAASRAGQFPHRHGAPARHRPPATCWWRSRVRFDIAGLELLLPLCVGGRVVLARPTRRRRRLAGPRLGRTARRACRPRRPPGGSCSSGWPGTPGMTALCGGEALAPALARSLGRAAGRLWNLYGPTETTIWSTCGGYAGAPSA